MKTNLDNPIGKDQRLIICHTRGANGWIEASPLVFSSKKTTEYQEEMHSETFEKWFPELLVPALTLKSIIVMDNASYHSRVKDKAPTIASRKAAIIQWLQEHGVLHGEDRLKVELKVVSEV